MLLNRPPTKYSRVGEQLDYVVGGKLVIRGNQESKKKKGGGLNLENMGWSFRWLLLCNRQPDSPLVGKKREDGEWETSHWR